MTRIRLWASGVVLFVLSSVGAVEATDCDGNGVDDADEIASSPELDCNGTGTLDECDVRDATRVGLGVPVSHPAQSRTAGVVVADLTGDGRPEFAAVNNGSSSVSVYGNRGGKCRQVEILVAGNHQSQRPQKEIGGFHNALGDRVVEVDPAGLQQKAQNEQKRQNLKYKTNHIVHDVVHLRYNPCASHGQEASNRALRCGARCSR